MSNLQRCINCKFWRRPSYYDDATSEEMPCDDENISDNSLAGHCHRFPPIATAERHGARFAEHHEYSACWPPTHHDTWCGEWQKRPDDFDGLYFETHATG